MKVGDRVDFLSHTGEPIRGHIDAIEDRHDGPVFDITFDTPRVLLGEPWRGTRTWSAESLLRPVSLLELLAEAAA